MYTAIHVDDDRRSLELMQLAAAELPALKLAASFTTGSDAKNWLQTQKADLVFLDVEMPDQNGFQLAKELAIFTQDIVFVTAHADFAVRAFEACAIDYLVKPVYADKLQGCLERYEQRLGRKNLQVQPRMQEQIAELTEHYLSASTYPQRIFVNMVGELRVITLDNVVYFGASGTYTKIILVSGETVVCSETIKLYSESLQKHPDFVRTHRSYLINKKHLEAIKRKEGQNFVRMNNGDTLPISQQRKNEILQLIAH